MFYADCCSQLWCVRVIRDEDVLQFCLHHWREHALALFSAGWVLAEDRTSELTVKAT